MTSSAWSAEEAPGGAQVNIARDRAVQNIVQGGDLHVHGGEPTYRVEEFSPHRPSLPGSVSRAPSRLLAARYQVVEFTGRESELAHLVAWRDDPGGAIGVFLVHGPGGQGKTRLAAQFAQRCADVGWVVAQAVHRSHDTARGGGLEAERVAAGRGLLVVVEYAERWPVSDLLALVGDPLMRAGVVTRVLLVARPAGPWWDSLAYRLQDRFDIPAKEMALGELAETTAARRGVFAAARDRFAGLLGVAEPDRIAPPADLEQDAFGLVLTVHMAALVAVDACARGRVPSADPATLSAYLLHREHDHWASMCDNGRVRTPPQMMGRAVFTATLTRPLSYPVGVTALARVGVPSPEQVLDDHRLCYPPGESGSVCEPLVPDRLGEDFLALQTPGHNVGSYQPDAWADTAVVRLLAADGEDGRLPPWIPATVTVLIETARRWPHIAARLCALLRERPQVAVAAGGMTLARLADLPEVDLGVLEAVEARLLPGRRVEFDIAVAALATRLTRHRLAITSDPAHRARLYVHLGYRLANAGRRVEALEATTEAVKLYRRVAEVNPAAVENDLAIALSNLGMMLSNLGRWAEALEATTEAVVIRRRLAAGNPAAFEPGLAFVLNNLSGHLSDLGRREQALAVTTEAVEIYRRVAEVNPAAFEPGLAKALTSLGNRLSDLGRRAEALAVTTEAVEIYRRVAEVNPAAFEPDLAIALTSLGNRLSDLGRRVEALAVTTEAVEIYRRLAEVNPATFEPDLALALNNLSVILSGRGEHQQALEATTEAVEIYRRVAAGNPAAFERGLARALDNLGIRLSNLGRRAEAVEATTEAVEIYRRLVAGNPAMFELNLAVTLNNLSVYLSNLERWEQALQASTEAVEIYRRLVAGNPTAFEPGLAYVLTNLGIPLSNLGRQEQALQASTETVEIYHRVAAGNPTAFEPGFARGLWIFARVRVAAQRELPQALTAAERSVTLYEGLVQRSPQAFTDNLHSSLTTLADVLDALGRRDDAAKARHRIDHHG